MKINTFNNINIEHLQSDNDKMLSFFSQLFAENTVSQSNIVQLTSMFKTIGLKKNDYFIQENQLGSTLGFVFSGMLRGYIIDLNGNEATIRFLQKYDLISGSFGVNTNSDLNIQCIDDSIIFEVSSTEMDHFVKNNSWLTIYFNSFFIQVHRTIIKRMASYIQMSGKERYKLFLKDYPNLINKIPQYYVANYLGITPIQLSRIRKEISKGK